MNTLKSFADRKLPVKIAASGELHIEAKDSSRVIAGLIEHLQDIRTDLENSGFSEEGIVSVLKNNIVNTFNLDETEAESFVRDFMKVETEKLTENMVHHTMNFAV